jgi:hypothetical protein
MEILTAGLKIPKSTNIRSRHLLHAFFTGSTGKDQIYSVSIQNRTLLRAIPLRFSGLCVLGHTLLHAGAGDVGGGCRNKL